MTPITTKMTTSDVRLPVALRRAVLRGVTAPPLDAARAGCDATGGASVTSEAVTVLAPGVRLDVGTSPGGNNGGVVGGSSSDGAGFARDSLDHAKPVNHRIWDGFRGSSYQPAPAFPLTCHPVRSFPDSRFRRIRVEIDPPFGWEKFPPASRGPVVRRYRGMQTVRQVFEKSPRPPDTVHQRSMSWFWGVGLVTGFCVFAVTAANLGSRAMSTIAGWLDVLLAFVVTGCFWGGLAYLVAHISYGRRERAAASRADVAPRAATSPMKTPTAQKTKESIVQPSRVTSLEEAPPPTTPPMPAAPPGPPPGWYEKDGVEGVEHFWDGTQWTGHSRRNAA